MKSLILLSVLAFSQVSLASSDACLQRSPSAIEKISELLKAEAEPLNVDCEMVVELKWMGRALQENEDGYFNTKENSVNDKNTTVGKIFIYSSDVVTATTELAARRLAKNACVDSFSGTIMTESEKQEGISPWGFESSLTKGLEFLPERLILGSEVVAKGTSVGDDANLQLERFCLKLANDPKITKCEREKPGSETKEIP